MTEEATGTDYVDGQAGAGPDAATSAAPDAGVGQPGNEANATTERTASAEDTFFDPRELKDDPKLQAAYKQMQRSYTKKMQELSKQREKIEAYDAFYSDPVGQIQRVAQQYGYHLSKAEAQAINDSEQDQGQQWQPQSWDEVLTRAEQKMLKKIEPFLEHVRTLRKKTIENQLSEIDPTWQQYEDRMAEMMKKHPSLASDPATLYRMSVPQEVLESRATQAALRKLEAKRDSNQVSGTSTTTRTAASGLPDKPVSFQEAYETAKRLLAEKGIRKQ